MQNDAQLMKILAAIMLCVISTRSLANNNFFNSPYLGIEAIQTNQNYQQGFGRGIYRARPHDYSAFFGAKFNRCSGLEIGYEYQPKRTRDVTLFPGQQLPGRNVISSGYVRVSSKIRGDHPYLGIFFEADQSISPGNKLKLQAMLGASYSRIRAQDSADIVNTYKKLKLIPMVKLSAMHNLSDQLGIRLSLNYHNFARFKIKAQNGDGEIRLKDTFGIGLALTYSFA